MTPGRTSRRPHIKSRTGCRNCKRRKVKCGEERPCCRNCLRRGVACDILERLGVPNAPAHQPATTSPASTSTGSGLPQSQTPSGGVGGATGITNLTMLDLELLHHYSTSTYLTLSADPVSRNYFLVRVPQLGFSHPYVLYSMLSLAASHLAHFRPESRQFYSAEATARHTAATSLATPLLSEISEANAVPMYFFSTFTLFISFATLRGEEDLFFNADDVMPGWLTLFRGMRTVLESNGRALLSSSISFLFQPRADVGRNWESNEVDLDALSDLQAFIDASTSEHDQERRHLLDAFVDLKRAFYSFYGEDLSNDAKIRSIFTWMYKISDDYINMLRHRNNLALCILAFFCVLLNRLEYNWWLKGWGTHLIDRIYTALDGVHRFRIRWPIQEIGWVPRRETI
ncbi:hypothetical protein B0I35DRAFT_445422 [Stachybotrys elegans]|uniref:Zn(2)-C6 fungal-type domain-containing protein n=1 Tax=Stachybotrys elegans TaxID=80388 RepID=A0A8K0WKN8_9HYPO|nr:hypothetical protein B0I35DRAFT_445422 [Stachybotrys elegans]